jgi:hypothetical protein
MALPKSLTTVTTFSKYAALALFIVVPFITFFIGYHFGGVYNAKTTYELVPMESKPTPLPTLTTNESAEWTTMTSEACALNVPLPPKKEPYYIPPGDANNIDAGKYWRFEESKPPADRPTDTEYTDIVHVVMRADNEPGSGYVAGNVFIQCGKNTNKATTADIVAKYKEPFANGSNHGLEIKQEATVPMWGQEATTLYMEGGMYAEGLTVYLLATPTHIYQVNKIVMSSNQEVQLTTNRIFNDITIAK